MKECIWDGETVCGWKELCERMIKTSEKFSEVMLKTTSISPIEESKELITFECMERFKSIVEVLASFIADGDNYQIEDYFNDSKHGVKLNCWILLGTLTETTLQMFFAFYLNDYKGTKWQQWDDLDVDSVQSSIFSCIQDLVKDKVITSRKGKSLKRAIREKIEEHTVEHKIQKVMLDELIQLSTSLNLFEEDETRCLKDIQSYRNGIHSFQPRDIGNWYDLKYSIHFFCYLMEWVLFHLPDIPDEEYY